MITKVFSNRFKDEPTKNKHFTETGCRLVHPYAFDRYYTDTYECPTNCKCKRYGIFSVRISNFVINSCFSA